jgi:hypothetical protein
MFAASQPSGRTKSQSQVKERDVLHTLLMPKRDASNASRTIAIRLADCEGQRSDASMLINRKYSQRGYGAHHKVPTTPDGVTFTASSDEGIIGTLSLTVDSDAGLALDRTFKEDLDEIRKTPGVKICELTKFAVDSSESSLKLLALLFHITFIYGTTKFGGTDLLIEVNPRHVRFYQTMLRFRRVGGVKTNAAVDAPSVLLWLKASDIRRHIDEHAGQNVKRSPSLYSHFFSPKEELGIFGRLMKEMEDYSLAPLYDRKAAPSPSHPH